MKKKQTELYLVIEESDLARVSVERNLGLAEANARDTAETSGGNIIYILKIVEAYYTMYPEEPEPEVLPQDLESFWEERC